MRKRTGMLVVTAVLAYTSAANAVTLTKGSQFFAIQLTEGNADLVNPEPFNPGTISAYTHSELGVQAQYERLFAENCAVNLSGGIGFFSETDKPGTNAAPGSVDSKYSQTSWQARIGIDEVGHITERLHLFVGPGIQVWSGKAKFESGSSSIESASTMRVAFHGRMAAHVAFNSKIGAFAQFGHYFGHASARENGAEATWWPSGHDGAAGFAFTF